MSSVDGRIQVTNRNIIILPEEKGRIKMTMEMSGVFLDRIGWSFESNWEMSLNSKMFKELELSADQTELAKQIGSSESWSKVNGKILKP